MQRYIFFKYTDIKLTSVVHAPKNTRETHPFCMFDMSVGWVFSSTLNIRNETRSSFVAVRDVPISSSSNSSSYCRCRSKEDRSNTHRPHDGNPDDIQRPEKLSFGPPSRVPKIPPKMGVWDVEVKLGLELSSRKQQLNPAF